MNDARVWLEAWKATVKKQSIHRAETAAMWADACLAAFRLRWPKRPAAGTKGKNPPPKR